MQIPCRPCCKLHVVYCSWACWWAQAGESLCNPVWVLQLAGTGGQPSCEMLDVRPTHVQAAPEPAGALRPHAPGACAALCQRLLHLHAHLGLSEMRGLYILL